MGNMSLLDIEAYSLDSSYVVAGSTHTFVVGKNDRTQVWENMGRGWEEPCRTLVASAQSFKEWLLDFIPCSCSEKESYTGINFGVNGVCHTIANRELLVSNNSADVRLAKKDEYSVLFFGKYGLGLARLKELLKQSYNKVSGKYNDCYGAFQKVMDRIDNSVDDELKAWRLIAENEIKIDVQRILDIEPYGGKIVARERLKDYINAREQLYSEYLSGKIKSQTELHRKMKSVLIEKSRNYLEMLRSIEFITDTELNDYASKIELFLGHYVTNVARQLSFALENNLL